MMALKNVLAGVAVADMEAARQWYERLLGSPPDATPMDGLAEWRFSGGGWLQLFEDRERAGRGSVTFVETDIDTRRKQLDEEGYEIRDQSRSDYTAVLILDDPDGNQLVFAQGIDPANKSAA